MPAPDTECFQIFLTTLAKKYPRQLILLFVDGAGNHHSDELKVPPNIMLHLLPPYSPELNLDCTPRVRHQNQGQVAIGVWFAAAPDPGWWFDSAQQAASERAPHSAVASERLAVVVAPCAASCERWLASNSIGD